MKQLCLIFVFCLVVGRAEAAIAPWTFERDQELGFRYSYPQHLFYEIEGDGKPAFHYFASPLTPDAKFLVGAWNNRKGQTPPELKHWLMSNLGGYDDITYQPHGRSWFVMSGYRGSTIYYEKVMFSCRGTVVNILAVMYPTAQRDFFDPAVEHMEDNFRPGETCS
jgi:hypothetical protein